MRNDLSNDATISSSLATVDNGLETIIVPVGTSLATFETNLTPAPGATFETYDADGTSIATTLSTGKKVIVTAENKTTKKTYIVTVAASTATNITAFSFGLPSETDIVNAGTVAVTVPYGTNPANLIAIFTLSPGASAKVGATAQISGSTSNDFTSPVTYTVTAEDGSTKQDWIVTVTVAANNAADITQFTVPNQIGNSTITPGARTVALTVPYGTNITALLASFTLSTGASAKVGITDQISGSTPNNFTNPVAYIVKAEDGTTIEWTVTVTVALNNAAEITLFTVPDQVGNSTINAANHTVSLIVPSGTNVTALLATFTLSTGASAKVGTTAQVSGTTPNNFTSPVTYIVKAEDGTTINWIVTVIAATTENDITGFSVTGQLGVSINSTEHKVSFSLPSGTDVTAIVSTITISAGATITPNSGVATNFTNPVVYTVTAVAGNTQDWTVSVILKSTENDITAFSIPNQIGASQIDASAHTVLVSMPTGTDLTALIPSITVSANAIINPVSDLAQNFTGTVNYIVTAQAGYTQNWSVKVSITTGIYDGSMSKLRVYPNPFNNEIKLDGIDENCKLSIYSLSGRISLDKTITNQDNSIDTQSLKSGLYLISVINDKGEKTTLKMIKE